MTHNTLSICVAAEQSTTDVMQGSSNDRDESFIQRQLWRVKCNQKCADVVSCDVSKRMSWIHLIQRHVPLCQEINDLLCGPNSRVHHVIECVKTIRQCTKPACDVRS